MLGTAEKNMSIAAKCLEEPKHLSVLKGNDWKIREVLSVAEKGSEELRSTQHRRKMLDK